MTAWQRHERIGDVDLYLGDCAAVLEDITPGSVNAVVTSPPYNQMTGLMRPPSGAWAKKDFGRAFVDKWQSDGYSDDLPEEEYQHAQNSIFAAIRKVCADDGSLFYNHQLRWRDGECLHPIDWFKPDGWRLRTEIIWDRCGGMMFNARMFCRFDERILWFTGGRSWKWNQSHVGLGTIWRVARSQNKDHPVAFPIKLPVNCIGAVTDPGDCVMDPYMGEGTTMIAAAKMGRGGIGIEKDPKWFDAACRAVDAVYRTGDMFVEPPAKAEQLPMFPEAARAAEMQRRGLK